MHFIKRAAPLWVVLFFVVDAGFAELQNRRWLGFETRNAMEIWALLIAYAISVGVVYPLTVRKHGRYPKRNPWD